MNYIKIYLLSFMVLLPRTRNPVLISLISLAVTETSVSALLIVASVFVFIMALGAISSLVNQRAQKLRSAVGKSFKIFLNSCSIAHLLLLMLFYSIYTGTSFIYVVPILLVCSISKEKQITKFYFTLYEAICYSVFFLYVFINVKFTDTSAIINSIVAFFIFRIMVPIAWKIMVETKRSKS